MAIDRKILRKILDATAFMPNAGVIVTDPNTIILFPDEVEYLKELQHG